MADQPPRDEPLRMQARTRAPDPDNDVVLRHVRGMRRDMAVTVERQARDIELRHRMTAQFDAGLSEIREELGRSRREMSAIRADLVLMENRILTAITEVRLLASRLDDLPVDPVEADGG